MGKISSNLRKYTVPILCVCLVLVSVPVIFLQANQQNESARIVLANLFLCLLLAPVVVLCGRYAYKLMRELDYQKRDCYILIAFVVLFSAAAVVFFVTHYQAEQDIKVYDYSIYWRTMLSSRERIGASITGYWAEFYTSLTAEYTHLAVIPLIPASYLLGTDYTGYCLSIFFVYYLPACTFLTILGLRIVTKVTGKAPGIFAWMLGFGVCALCPVFLWPLMHGYLDVAGVVIVAILLNYTLDWDGVQFSWKRNAILCLLSVVLLLTRRWYAYFIVGFYAAYGVTLLIDMVRKRKFLWKDIGFLALNMGSIAGAASLLILVISPEIFSLFLGRDYSSEYSAYKTVSTGENLLQLANQLGWLFVLVAVWACLRLLSTSDMRHITIRLLFAGTCAFGLMRMVQNVANHHFYLVLPVILVFVMVPILLLFQRVSSKAAVGGGLALALVFNFAIAQFPILQPVASLVTPPAAAIRNYPVVNENYDVYVQIVRDLKEKTQEKSNSVYVVGEGSLLSHEYLRRTNLPDEIDAAPFVMESNIVDIRDGFPSQLFIADYILVASPFSTDFSDIQQISYQVYDMLLNDAQMAEYYQLDTTYPLADGEHDILLFRKVRQTDKAGVDILKQRLMEYYPDDPFVYEPNYFLALLDLENEPTAYYDYWNDAFNLHKTGEAPIRFSINDTATFTELSFELYSETPGFEMVVENQTGEIYRGEVPAQGGARSTIDITGSEFISITIENPSDEAQTGEVRLGFDQTSLT